MMVLAYETDIRDGTDTMTVLAYETHIRDGTDTMMVWLMRLTLETVLTQ